MGIFDRFKLDVDKLEAKEDAKGLIKALRSKESDVRMSAAKALGKIGDARAVEPLIQALRDDDGDDELQRTVTAALQKLGMGAVEPLIRAMRDSNANVRSRAAWTLGEIRDARAVEPLIRALKDECDDVRGVSADALGKIGDTRAVKPLIQALKAENYEVRQRILETLGKLVKPGEILLIQAMTGNHEDFQRPLAEAGGLHQ
jgi:HEAT repeat protein